jgi:hypothetical protein
MDTALIVVILLLTFLLVLVILLYFYTQQGFRDLVMRIGQDTGSAQAQAATSKGARNPDAVRRERSVAHDKLVLLEAELSVNPREALTPEDIETFESSRKAIKACNDSLKTMGNWLGLPFDLEWVEIQQRQPKLNELYRQFVEQTVEKAEQGQAAAQEPQAQSRW